MESAWLQETAGSSVREFFAELGVVLPDRGGGEAPVRCFANPSAHNHEDRIRSCSVNLLSGLWHCKGCGARGSAYAAAVARGYSNRAAAELARRFGLFGEPNTQPKPRLPTEPQVRKWREQMTNSPHVIRRLGRVRGWSEEAIRRCGLGWDGERIVFPLRERKGDKLSLVGVARYLPGGSPKMLSVSGSKRVLFPSVYVTSRRLPLFIVEGEPDAVAVWSVGHQAVGVPGAGSWRREWAQSLWGRQVIVLPDCDQQGRGLAERIANDVPDAKVVDLDADRSDGWDVGDAVCEASAEGGLGQVHRWLGRIGESV